MDSIFLMDEGERTNFLKHLMHSFACTYICLWSYLPQPSFNYLIFLDGVYQEEDNQPSSSSGSLARRLFDEYRQSVFMVDTGRIPGLAFKNRIPYIELNELDLRRLVSTEAQLQFYQVIDYPKVCVAIFTCRKLGLRFVEHEKLDQTAIFMGCKTGEIELGISNKTQVNMEMEMKNWFPEDFSRLPLPQELSQLPDQNPHSSSSSSLRSLSIDSPEPSPFLFNIPTTTYIPLPPIEVPPLRPISTTTTTSTPPPLGQQPIQTLTLARNIQFPTSETEDATMTKAILAVLSSSSPSSASSHWPHKASAFKNYRSALAPTSQITTRCGQQNLLKRAMKFFSGLNLRRTQEQFHGTRPTTTQLHHMISERRRREKLNESFQALRSLLPPGSKRDKASVLTNTTEYLGSLKAQVEELGRRNRILEAQLPRQEGIDQEESGSSVERVGVRITDVGESTSEARTVDLHVNVRGECSMLDLVIRVMEFLKQLRNVTLMSIEAETRMIGTNTINRVILRLNIEGGEWDESAFQEAVRRVVDDLAQ